MQGPQQQQQRPVRAGQQAAVMWLDWLHRLPLRLRQHLQVQGLLPLALTQTLSQPQLQLVWTQQIPLLMQPCQHVLLLLQQGPGCVPSGRN